MRDNEKTKAQLIAELDILRKQLSQNERIGEQDVTLMEDPFISILKNQVYNIFIIDYNDLSKGIKIKSIHSTSEEEEALFGARIGKQYSFVKKDLLSPAIFSIISEVKNSGKPAHQIINLFDKQEYNFWCDVLITPEDSHRLLLFYKNVTEIDKLVQVL